MLKADGKPWLTQCLERDTAPESSLLPREPWAWFLPFFKKKNVHTHTYIYMQSLKWDLSRVLGT